MEDISTGKENSGMALSGMIIGIVGLICAFLPAWRGFGIIISAVGLVVSIYSFYKAKKSGAKKTRSTIGIFTAIAAVLVGSYFLLMKLPNNGGEQAPAEEVPVEFKDTTVLESDHTNALEKLQGLTDSTTAP